MELEKNVGQQPISKILDDNQIENKQLVAASTEQLTFKNVSKIKKGIRVTRKIQQKALNALQTLLPEEKFVLKDLFTY